MVERLRAIPVGWSSGFERYPSDGRAASSDPVGAQVAANGDLVYAKDVAVGDLINHVSDDGALKSGTVVSTTRSFKRGLYNPYTLSGTIVVDGVAASCHSSWILDGFLPPRVAACVETRRHGRSMSQPRRRRDPLYSTQVAAVVYQRLFVVPRLAYKLLGPEGMDRVFGVGNSGASASIAKQTGMLFGVCAVLLGVGAIAARKVARV